MDFEELQEWAYHYIRNRDIIARSVAEIDKDESGLIVKYKDNSMMKVLALADLNRLDISEEYSKVSVVTPNSIANIKWIMENWDKVKDHKGLTIYFVNPKSRLDKKWVLHPYTHNKICDSSALRTGIKAMSDMVEKVR